MVVEEERKAESPEFEVEPKPEAELKSEADVEPQAAVEAETKEDPGLAVEEEPKEELSFEEARKRYTDYKEEEES